MAIFNSYVKFPEGITIVRWDKPTYQVGIPAHVGALRQHTKVYGQPTKRLEDLGSFSWHPKRSEIGKTAKQPAYCLGAFFEKQDHVVLGYPICTYLGVWAVVFSPAGAGESNPIYMGLMLSHPANPVSMFILWRDNKIF